jgi:HK97 family phage major capsid protein
MDALEKALVDQGMTVDEAVEHLKNLALAKQKARDGETDDGNLRKLVDDIVDKQIAALARPKELPEIPSEPVAVPARLQQDMWLACQIRRSKEFNVEALTSAFQNHGFDYTQAQVQKALDTTDTSTLVPAVLQRQLYMDIEKESVILNNFRVIDLPNNPWEMPYQASSLTIYGVDESTTDTATAVAGSDLTFDKITFNAKKLGARVFWSRELEEDALISILPVIREDLVRITRNGWERCFIMGDETTANTNINNYGTAPTTTAGAKDYWLQVDGLVHNCLVTHTAQKTAVGAAMDATKFNTVRAVLDKYGTRPGDLAAVMPRELWYDMLVIDEVMTPDTYLNQATILTGELGRIYGIPLLVSDGMPLTDANGWVDDEATNNTKKSILIVNRPYGVLIGRRGEMRLAQEDIIDTDQTKAVIFSRYDLQFPFWAATVYGYNVT